MKKRLSLNILVAILMCFIFEISPVKAQIPSSSNFIIDKKDIYKIVFNQEIKDNFTVGLLKDGVELPVVSKKFNSYSIAVSANYKLEEGNYDLNVNVENVNGVKLDKKYTLTVVDKDKRISELQNWNELNYQGVINAFNPTFDLSKLGINTNSISGLSLEKDGQKLWASYDFKDNILSMINIELKMSSSYVLKLFMEDGKRYNISFKSSYLPEIIDDGVRKVIKIPAMPEKGFYWPYFIAIPSNVYKQENLGYKRYLMVDTNNTGANNDFERTLSDTKLAMETRNQSSIQMAEELWTPMIMPAFPRPMVGYYDTVNNEYNQFYTHAFDRDIATLHLKMQIPAQAETLRNEFRNAGFNVNDFMNLDKQLCAMIDHAVSYLNQYGQNVQANKVFLNGYSASGTFVDRFTALHPDRVKAVASGATLDDMIIPVKELNGQQLIFPIGTSDYKSITGKDFNLIEYNKPARLIYMGKNDTNNTIPFSDCYGNKERNIITSLWGEAILPRAQALTKLYGDNGGKGMFILDKDIEHGYSQEMRQYTKAFFKVNRESIEPVYPIPLDADQLQYTLYK